MSDGAWYAVRVRPRGGDEAYDAVLAALFAAGSQGVHEDGPIIVTQFPPETDIAGVHDALIAADAFADVSIGAAESIDWTEGWKSLVVAHDLGALAVSPPWLADGVDISRTIVIDPGMAFGTGDHPTTRGMLRLMPAVIRAGDLVADLGAGSAILSIAAAKLGAGRIVAIEFDADAIGNAEENVARNDAAHAVTVIQGDASILLPLVAPVRVVLANIISSVLIALMPAIRDGLTADGEVVFSGMLVEERDRMIGAFTECGFRVTAEDAEDAWWTAAVRRA